MTGQDPSAPSAAVVIALDGPSGAGKTTAAKTVARELGLRYLDTGATYRALAWDLLRRRVDCADPAAITVAVADGLPPMHVGTDPEAPSISVVDTDVSAAIRGPEVTATVSPISAVPAVRALLVDLQRAIIGSGGIVVEGRDIGTVVAPNAEVKFFLTADIAARAARRAAEQAGADSVEAIRAALEVRDARDSTRHHAPLTLAPDAHQIDATFLTLDEVVAQVVGTARRELAARGLLSVEEPQAFSSAHQSASVMSADRSESAGNAATARASRHVEAGAAAAPATPPVELRGLPAVSGSGPTFAGADRPATVTEQRPTGMPR